MSRWRGTAGRGMVTVATGRRRSRSVARVGERTAAAAAVAAAVVLRGR